MRQFQPALALALLALGLTECITSAQRVVERPRPDHTVPGAESRRLVPQFILEFGGKGDEPGKFHSPIRIAINGQDELFITEYHTHRVQKFKP